MALKYPYTNAHNSHLMLDKVEQNETAATEALTIAENKANDILSRLEFKEYHPSTWNGILNTFHVDFQWIAAILVLGENLTHGVLCIPVVESNIGSYQSRFISATLYKTTTKSSEHYEFIENVGLSHFTENTSDSNTYINQVGAIYVFGALAK